MCSIFNCSKRPKPASDIATPPTMAATNAAAATANAQASSATSDSKQNIWADLFTKTKVSDIVRKGKAIVVVNTDQSPTEAFQTIVNNHILSAPVWDKASNSYVGFLDTRDLTQFVVFQAEELEEQKHHSHKSNLLEPPPVDIKFIFESAAKMYKQPLENVTVKYLARTNRWAPVSSDDSLLKVIELLATGCHRVPVVLKEDPNKIVDIISQSTLIQFIHAQKAVLQDVLNVKIAAIHLGSRPVIPVKEHASALECFKTMAKLNRSGVAIVDEKGTLVGNTSGSDLRLFIANPHQHIGLLHKTIGQFLSSVRRAEISENPNTRSPVIAVHPDATLDKVVGKLTATRIHRLFVADDKTGFKPEAVISITDILRYVLNKAVPKTVPVHVAVDSA